ncbi:7-methylguanosine phosphate-specific 5'-nucleotidase [Liparis tanakae]|uniref:5'-nucleotidase n=1 Tax=Liparis tanakae TaxID=230148 RepID=A0A4Z2G0Y3_9TELE|nr:7-methylguanosine phosphate-specific 5'-nucleotidase [Liparis tanakae]
MQIYHIPWIYAPVRTVLSVWHRLTKTEIPELAKCSVLMRERSRVEEMIRAMQRAGAGSLQMRELLNTYYPIEIDACRTAEEKLPLMVEWWTKVHELLIQQKIRKDLLARAVEESSAMLRDGYKLFFDRLTEERVPLLIFSAGVGDVLEEVIRQNHVFSPNVHIISNYMDFDQTGVLRAFKGQLIHTFNKREGALSHAAGLRQLQGRPNVLLLGDSLGDLTMADGVSEHQHILTIGFLNDKVEERRESYVNSFDIVLVQDETMDVANAILRCITSPRHK